MWWTHKPSGKQGSGPVNPGLVTIIPDTPPVCSLHCRMIEIIARADDHSWWLVVIGSVWLTAQECTARSYPALYTHYSPLPPLSGNHYFGPTLLVVSIMLGRIPICKSQNLNTEVMHTPRGALDHQYHMNGLMQPEGRLEYHAVYIISLWTVLMQ